MNMYEIVLKKICLDKGIVKIPIETEIHYLFLKYSCRRVVPK